MDLQDIQHEIERLAAKYAQEGLTYTEQTWLDILPDAMRIITEESFSCREALSVLDQIDHVT